MMKRLKEAYELLLKPFKRGGEEVFTTSKRIWIHAVLVFLLGVFIEAVYLILPGLLDWIIDSFALSFLLVVLLGFIWAIAKPWFDIYNTYHELGPHHVVSIQGLLLSMKRKEFLVPYELILGCEVQQNIFGRIFDYGDVLLGTRMTGKTEVRLSDIDSPHKVMYHLEKLIGEHT